MKKLYIIGGTMGVGKNYSLIAGFSMDEGIDGGKSAEDCIIIAKMSEENGIVVLHLRHGSYDSPYLLHPTNFGPTSIAVDAAAEIRKHVSIPVMVDGSLINPETCSNVLQEGKADLVGVARPLLADLEWIKKPGKEERKTSPMFEMSGMSGLCMGRR